MQATWELETCRYDEPLEVYSYEWNAMKWSINNSLKLMAKNVFAGYEMINLDT